MICQDILSWVCAVFVFFLCLNKLYAISQTVWLYARQRQLRWQSTCLQISKQIIYTCAANGTENVWRRTFLRGFFFSMHTRNDSDIFDWLFLNRTCQMSAFDITIYQVTLSFFITLVSIKSIIVVWLNLYASIPFERFEKI